MKTFLDILLAFIAVLIVIPFMLLFCLLILIIDFQNPIFIQHRLGLKKRQFRIVKLRTMKNQKITFLGKVFRKTGIDELPQLINILKGDMSFVGPRPLTKADVERLNWTSEYYDLRWSKKPGIVGLAQLSPTCHRKMSWNLDKMYIAKGSLKLDAKIIFSSALIIFLGKKRIQNIFYNRT